MKNVLLLEHYYSPAEFRERLTEWVDYCNRAGMMQNLTDRGGSVLCYKGSNGRLLVSARQLDETLSTADVSAHSFGRVEKLQPGEIVDIEIDLFSIGVGFYPG